ncbi:MAG: BamA/TamA family outer membrane protein, partial [Bacteroidota bacterium]
MDSYSQVDTSTLKVLSNDKQEIDNQKNEDIIDLLKIKRRDEELENPRKKTMKPRATFVPFIGYTLQTRLAGILAGNIAFYSDDLDGRNQSAISTSISYSQNKQIIIPVLSNIWTKRNRYNILGNWRYYKYPEQTYGLGGQSSLKNKTKLDYQYFLFRESVLRHISNSAFYLGLGYNLSYHSDIIQIPFLPGELTDFDKYGRTKKSCSSGLSIHALFDNRGNTINPQKGAYLNLTFYHYAKFLASDNNWDALILDMRRYLKLGKAKNVLAIWSYNWFTFGGKRPYLDLPSTGWDAYSNIGRGYIQSRLRGENLIYLELEYRFKISHNGILGGVLFTNAQSVTNWPSNKFTTIFPAAGTGIRVKLNKFSGTNLSIDYGFGLQGSQGLFI